MILLALMGCERNSGATPRGRLPPAGSKVFVIGPGEFDSCWPALRGGAGRAARRAPYLRFEYVAPREAQAAQLNALVDEVLAQRPVAICLSVSDPASTVESIDRILHHQTLLVTMGAAVETLHPFAQVRVNLPDAAEQLGAALADVIGDGRSYLLLHENGDGGLGTTCVERFMSTARRHVALTLLQQRSAYQSLAPQDRLVRELIERFQNASLIVTLNPQPWLTTPPGQLLSAAARVPSREPSDAGPANQPDRPLATRQSDQNGSRSGMRFATLSACPALWGYLRTGQAAALVGPLDGEIGFAAVALVLEGLSDVSRAGAVRWIGCEVVTPTSLDDFAQRYAAAGEIEPADLLPPGGSASQPRDNQD